METLLSATTTGICDQSCLKQGVHCLTLMQSFVGVPVVGLMHSIGCSISTTIAEPWMAMIAKHDEAWYGRAVMCCYASTVADNIIIPSTAPCIVYRNHGCTEELGRKSWPQPVWYGDRYPVLFLKVSWKSVEISASVHIYKVIAKFGKLLNIWWQGILHQLPTRRNLCSA